jgi:hypothetical protein
MDLFRLYYEIKKLFLIKEVQALFTASLPKAGVEISFFPYSVIASLLRSRRRGNLNEIGLSTNLQTLWVYERDCFVASLLAITI